MTNEEAIKLLNSVTIYYGGKCTRNAIDIAIGALEKQIAKKPRRTNGGLHIAKKDFYTKCQLCNHNIPVVVRDGRMRFCPFCGQKIDWSDDE